MTAKAERKAYAKINAPGGVFYMMTPSIVLGRGPASVDLALSGDPSVSRRHAQIDFHPDLQQFEISVIGKNGIFVNGDYLRKGDRPLVLKSHTDIIIGRGNPRLLTFFLPGNPTSKANKKSFVNEKDHAPVTESMLSMVGQVLILSPDPLDAKQICDKLLETRPYLMDTAGSREVLESSVRAAITGNRNIFVIHPAFDMDVYFRDTQPGSNIPPRTHAAFTVHEDHKLRFLKARAHVENGAPKASFKVDDDDVTMGEANGYRSRMRNGVM